MSRILLIRHGPTPGNALGRYIGKTDESLSGVGVRQARKIRLPDAEYIYVSPMKRCIETARILYPQKEIRVVEGLKECDFGTFENKSCQDLSSNPNYIRWIDSGGTLPFPGGESREVFIARCVGAFEKLDKSRDCGFVVHGGTIMALLSRYGDPVKDYYDYRVSCLDGYICEWNGRRLTNIRALKSEEKRLG